jgi:hypothetical protein
MRIRGLSPIRGFPGMNQHKTSVYGAAAPKNLSPSLRMEPLDIVSIARALGVPPHDVVGLVRKPPQEHR